MGRISARSPQLLEVRYVLKVSEECTHKAIFPLPAGSRLYTRPVEKETPLSTCKRVVNFPTPTSTGAPWQSAKLGRMLRLDMSKASGLVRSEFWRILQAGVLAA